MDIMFKGLKVKNSHEDLVEFMIDAIEVNPIDETTRLRRESYCSQEPRKMDSFLNKNCHSGAKDRGDRSRFIILNRCD